MSNEKGAPTPDVSFDTLISCEPWTKERYGLDLLKMNPLGQLAARQAAQLKRAREDFDAVKAVAEDFADLYRNEQTRADKAEGHLKEARKIIDGCFCGDKERRMAIESFMTANPAPAPAMESEHGND